MLLRKRFNPRMLIGFGLAMLVVASVFRWALPHLHASAAHEDFFAGMFYGMSIACMLLGIAARRRQGPTA